MNPRQAQGGSLCIIYTRRGPTLHVRIEGKPGGRSAEWTWSRARLPAH